MEGSSRLLGTLAACMLAVWRSCVQFSWIRDTGEHVSNNCFRHAVAGGGRVQAPGSDGFSGRRLSGPPLQRWIADGVRFLNRRRLRLTGVLSQHLEVQEEWLPMIQELRVLLIYAGGSTSDIGMRVCTPTLRKLHVAFPGKNYGGLRSLASAPQGLVAHHRPVRGCSPGDARRVFE